MGVSKYGSARRSAMRTPYLSMMMACIAGSFMHAQTVQAQCVQPLCVNRIDDRANEPLPGMLRYAVREAPPGSTITFDPALNGQTIKLDSSSPTNQIRITRDVSLHGPGANLLAISGGRKTRLFLIDGGSVRIAGLTLADGLAKGGNGVWGTGGGGGGGGAAGLGGAIFLNQGALTLEGVVVSGNQAAGGDGGNGGGSPGVGRAGSGGGSDLTGGQGGAGGEASAIAGGEGLWGAGGGGGFTLGATGGSGGGSVFGGGVGGTGGYKDEEGTSSIATAGTGGSGMGGAIFARSGLLQLIDTTFANNTATAGGGGSGAPAGLAKGGALFICSANLCGSGSEAAAVWFGKLTFRDNAAADAGGEQSLPGRDNVDVCGHLSAPVPTHLSIVGPPGAEPGEPFGVAVTALDASNNVVQTYTGKVHMVSSDPNAVLPPDAELSNGIGVFLFVMKTAGKQTVSGAITTAASIKGTSNSIVVNKE